MKSTTNVTKNLRIASWNSRGLSAAIPYLRKLLSENDFVSISEHWLHRNQLSRLNDISEDFLCLGRSSRSSTEDTFGIRRGSGGVAIFWRSTLTGVTPLLNINHDRICGVRMQADRYTVVNILSVYMPASGSVEDLSSVLDELACIIESFEEGAVNIVTGDLNGDIGMDGGPRSTKPPTRAGKIILDFIDKYNFIAANLQAEATGSIETFSCHNGASTIDYVLIPNTYKDIIVTCHTDPDHVLNTSDHYPIQVIMKLRSLPGCVDCPPAKKNIRWDKLRPDQVYEVYEGPLANMLRDLTITEHDDAIAPDEIDLRFDKLVSVLHKAAARVPRSKYTPHLKPYWSQELTALKKEKMRWFIKWKEQGRTTDSDDYVRVKMKQSKKAFHKAIRTLSRKYENDSIAEAARLAEVDKDHFWRIFKRLKGPQGVKVHAIKDAYDNVVYDIDSVLGVWRNHFSHLSTPKESTSYDQEHYQYVTDMVKGWRNGIGKNVHLETPFTPTEIAHAIEKLHSNKAPGHDSITAEHLKHGGRAVCLVICELFNECVRAEYIPYNFRQGIQIPLYKGKNTCPLDPDNYRGITLLSSFNKLFEMVLWLRIEQWWEENRVISELQGACRKGSSCVHTALTLQETIASHRERGEKVFVAFFDVSKAFDSVWIDGLFFQLHKLGITGSLWRLLYKGYIDFYCSVRIGDRTSLPYPMLCGIHQGGYLSLLKYIAFINSLITELKDADLCCSIGRIKSTPLGYADDLATCTLSGSKMHHVMGVVGQHGRTWRYSFNAKKSAVMVFGETPAESLKGSSNRMFKLGQDRVKETQYYDHVGIKTCLKGDFYVRTEEKVKKARTALNMATCMGIRKGGLNILTCCIIYWTVVIPTLCFGCELWILKQKDIQILQSFQRYAARRIQRLHPRSLNATSRVCLGWIDVVYYIMAKKAIFIRSIIMMKDYIPIRNVLAARLEEYPNSISTANAHDSPIFDLLNTCSSLKLLPTVRTMMEGTFVSKKKWKDMVWASAWACELNDWYNLDGVPKEFDLLSKVSVGPSYSVWWQISDRNHTMMRMCEVMVKILCKASLLKDDDCRLKRQPCGSRMCTRCELGAPENGIHMIMQCPANEHIRSNLNKDVESICPDKDPQDFFGIILGRGIIGWTFESMVPIWEIAARYITCMYFDTLKTREGIG